VYSAVRAADDGWDGCDFPTADRSVRGVLCPAGTLAVGQTVQLSLPMVRVPTFMGQFLVEARTTGLLVAIRFANVA
jgi:UDP:flavonoid glycosyltransferase YjiC (YdhE family)